MTIIGDVFVRVRGDTTGFHADTEKGVLSSVTGIAKKAAGIIGGAFVVKKGFDFLSDSVDAARESNKVAAQTEAVIKSTGAAAHLSAAQFGDLATAISNKTGVDDEAIQSAENLLATFTNVRNEAGKGNDIFNQATATLVDMGAALGTDASGSAIQLGKALNDPIKGIAALTRVGVTFTDEQQKQIKAMQENGDMAGAQKVILAELAKEFGGSAAAQATAADRLKITLGNLQEELGAKLIPIIDRVATWLADHLPAAIDTAGRAFDRVRGFVAPIVETVMELAHVLHNAFSADDTFGLTGDDGLEGKAAVAGTALRDIFDTVKQVFGVLFQGDFKGGGPFEEDSPFIAGLFRFREIAQQVVGFIADHWKPILLGLGLAFAAITAPVTTVVAALIYAYTRFQAVRDVVAAVVEAVKVFVAFVRDEVAPAVMTAFGAIADVIGSVVGFFQDRSDKFAEAFEHIGNVVQAVISFVDDVITEGVAAILWVWDRFGDNILAIIGAVWEEVKVVVDTAIRVVKDVIDLVLNLINGDWGDAWHAFRDLLGAVWDFITATVGNALRIVWELIKGAVELIAGVLDIVWEGVKKGVKAAFDWVVDHIKQSIHDAVELVTGLPGKLLDLVGKLNDAGVKLATGLINGLVSALGKAAGAALGFAKDFANAIIRFVNEHIIDTINSRLEFKISALGQSFTVNPPDLPHLPLFGAAAGALVAARPGGTALLTGEAGMPEAVVPLPPGLLAGLQAIAADALAGGDRSDGVVFQPGAVQLVFQANPTPEEAFAAGDAAADALSRALAGRRLAVTVRAG